MVDAREEAERFLSDRPGAEAALRDVLAVDAANDRWTFEDLDVDSGTFGEIVSRELVEKRDEGYVVPEPTAIRGALGDEVDAAVGDDGEGAATGAGFGLVSRDELDFPAVDRVALGALAAVLLVVAAFRVLVYPSVFRSGGVVYLGNDPYSYWYWTRTMLAQYGTFDPTLLGSLRPEIAGDDVTLFVALWAYLSLAPGAADALLAWYPVLAAVLTGVGVYALTTRLTADRRIALAAVLMLAVTPVHAYRTTVGFADHHAFDYLLLSVTLFALAALGRDRVRSKPAGGDFADGSKPAGGDATGDSEPDRRRGPTTARDWFDSRRGWALACLLGLAVTAQIFAWRGSPILVAPLAAYVTALAYTDVRAGDSPAAANRYLLVGLAVAAVLSSAALSVLGWGNTFRGLFPAALLLGTVAVFAAGEAVRRLDVSARVAAAGIAGTMVAVSLGIWLLTSVFDRLVGRAESWVTGAVARETAGTDSLVGVELGTVLGPLFVFGLVLFVALPVVAWITGRIARGERRVWLPLVVYFWYLLGWTAVFVRFGGSLAVAAAPFAGYGFVFLPARIDVFRSPVLSTGESASETGGPGPRSGAASDGGPSPLRRSTDDGRGVPELVVPSRTTVAWILAFFLVVGSFSFVQIPVKQSQLALGGDKYETAQWLGADTVERGLAYPDNYVLSRWDDNRVYNYFANGVTANYTYAEDTYEPFLASTAPGQWYDRLSGKVGYVVVDRSGAGYGPSTMYSRLYDAHGSDTGGTDALERYRAVYESPGGAQKVFTLVPGAVLTGTGPPNSSVTVERTVDLVHDSVEYRQTVETTANGHFAARVPHAGAFSSDAGSVEANASEDAVREGGFAVAGGSDRSRWTFGERRGTVVFDERGTNHGFVRGAEWVGAGDDGALALDGESNAVIPSLAEVSAETGVTLSARFRTADGVDYRSDRRFAPIVANAPASGANLRASGYALSISEGRIAATLGDGESFRHVEGPAVDDGDWHRATLQYDGTHLRLYLDGELVERKPLDAADPPAGQSLYVGGPPGSDNFAGQVDGVAFAASVVESPAESRAGNETG